MCRCHIKRDLTRFCECVANQRNRTNVSALDDAIALLNLVLKDGNTTYFCLLVSAALATRQRQMVGEQRHILISKLEELECLKA